jgi:hypothetical protein
VSPEETAALQAEVIALQAVLMAVFRRIADETPELGALFCAAFDDAETILAGVAMKRGMESQLATTTAALTVIEELRRAVIRDPSVCP